MSSSDFLKDTLAGFADTLQPLRDSVESPEAFTAFLKQFGWTLTPSDLTSVLGALHEVATLATNPSSLSLDQLTHDLIAAATAVRKVASSGAPAAFATTFPRELLDYLVYAALVTKVRPLFGLLHFAGVLGERRIAANAATGRADYIERQVHWDRLGQLADNPLNTIESVYGWGSPAFDGDALVRSIAMLASGIGARAGIFNPQRQFVSQYYAPNSPSAVGLRAAVISVPGLDQTVVAGGAQSIVKLAFLAMPIPPSATSVAAADGVVVLPLISGKASDTINLADSITLNLTGDFLARPVRAEFHPGHAILRATPGDTHVDASARFDAKAPPSEPWVLIGSSKSSRLEMSAAHVTFGLTGTLDGDLELTAEVGVDAASLVIDFSEGDSLMQGTVSKQSTKSALSLTIKWSSKSGFSLGGQPKLQITLPVQQSLAGVATLQQISFALSAASGNRLEFDAMLTGTISIGPVALEIQNVGLAIFITPSADTEPPGVLGNIDFGFGFKSPTGVGLSIDAAGVSGGGFLAYEETKQEYSGVLQLQYANLALQAFGLITTEVAGGQGYSLLALIDANFPPEQLGWGFTLNGVGGLLAVHRTASVDALRAGVKADALSNVLFPKNAITNAPQILAALDTFFPTAPGRFLFGPMALIGWGTPTLLTAALAIIVELPEPVRIILLGRLAARIPSDSDTLIRINMDSLGVLDLSQGTLALDATLFDSRLLSFTLAGDMALRASWTGQGQFLISVGGYHPRFTPPSGFPSLKRMSLDMASGAISTLHLESYLAITSNTLQMGANLHVKIGVSAFSIDGHLGFDALFHRHPFHLDADISGSVAVSIEGEDFLSVSLDATLTGPAPWNLSGNFKVHIVFFDVHKSFSETWGDDAAAELIDAVDVGAVLAKEFADVRSWSAQLPDGVPALVTTRDLQNTAVVVAHPLAQLGVHERTVPLGLDITRFGPAPLSGANHFAISDFQIGATALTYESVEDGFASAQFFDLTDDQKLEQPSFERHDAGVRMNGGRVTGGVLQRLVTSGSSVNKTLQYETFFVDQQGGELRSDDPKAPKYTRPIGEVEALLSIGSAGRATMMRAGNRRYAAPGNPIHVAEPAFVVVDTATLAPVGLGAVSGNVYSDARALLREQLNQFPGQQGHLQIVATHEMLAA